MTQKNAADTNKMNEKLFEQVQRRYDLELQGSKDLDSKAGSLIGYVGIVTTLILGIGTFELLGNLTKPEYFILYFIGVTALALSIIFSLLATRIRIFEFRPLDTYVEEYVLYPKNKNYSKFLRTSIIQMTVAFMRNNAINWNKGKLIKLSYLFFVVGIILLLSYAIIFSVVHEKVLKPKVAVNQNNSVTTINNDTLTRLISGEQIKINPYATFNVNNSIYQATNLPWMEIKYQWLKDNLSIYVIVNKTSFARDQNITNAAINDWITLLRLHSANSSAWNVNVNYIPNDNLTTDPRNPPDIILDLFDEPNVSKCSDRYGEADAFHEDQDAQYARIYTSCGTNRLSSDSLYKTVSHEFAHTLGLGHAHVQNTELMCGTSDQKLTCHRLPPAGARPSELDLGAIQFIYGKDGFGGYNRVLVDKPAYVVNETK